MDRMKTPSPRRQIALRLVLGLAVVAGACQSRRAAPPPSADAWATVDGREIKQDAVEKAYRRSMQVGATPSEEEATMAKLSALNDLIVQDILLEKARELKLEIADNDLNVAYAEARKDIPDQQFQQELTRRNLTAADMREGLRREMLTQKVIEHEVTSKISITDQDVNDFYKANIQQFNRPEDSYRLAQIVITPQREAQRVNRSGNDAGTPQEAAAKAQAMMERLKQGAQFSDLAADFSEDPQSAQRGGDLGFVPLSALQKAPPALRDAVLKANPGTVSAVTVNGVHTIVLVIAKEPAGQRDPSMPEVKQGITNTLKQRREQMLQAAYLSAMRNNHTVVNILAQRVIEGQGKAPSLAPQAPAAKP
jgi:peptidyl-prolyl cis-trans isomerase SurA